MCLMKMRSSLHSDDPEVYIPSAACMGTAQECSACYWAEWESPIPPMSEAHLHTLEALNRPLGPYTLGDLERKAQGADWPHVAAEGLP